MGEKVEGNRKCACFLASNTGVDYDEGSIYALDASVIWLRVETQVPSQNTWSTVHEKWM